MSRVLATALLLLVDLTLAALGACLLALGDTEIGLLVLGVTALGTAAAGMVLHGSNVGRRAGRSAAQPGRARPAGPNVAALPSDESQVLQRAAERLASSTASEGKTLVCLPMVLVLGDAGTGKTSLLTHGGLDAEPLAGQGHPEVGLGLWLARNAVFAEASGALLSDPARWASLMKALAAHRPLKGRGPTAALVCVHCDLLRRDSEAALLDALCHTAHARLAELSRQLGHGVPTYVLFTQADRLPSFPEFVGHLRDDESSQVFGSTLTTQAVPGSDPETRLAAQFDDLFHSLCDRRLELLVREREPARLSAAYEFPREFRKQRATVLRVLRELGRNSQLTPSPVVRGFYFTGLRHVPADRPQDLERSRSLLALAQATGVFQARPEPAPPRRMVAQWIFTRRLFHDVILRECGVMRVDRRDRT